MPTQIIDGFKLNSATPIDSRLVTTGTASRNSMVYKYNGLRVYDTVQKMSFVYIDNDWEKESSENIVTTSGNGMNLGGTENYIPKITSYGTTSSIIREFTTTGNQRRIGINVPNNKTIDAILHVVGTSGVAALFDGQVTATNFVGKISGNDVVSPVNIVKLSNPATTGTYVLKSIDNTNQWVAETTGSKILIAENTTEANLFLVLSKDTDSTGNELYINKNTAQDALAVNAKTRQLMVSTSGTFKAPQYSFIGILNAGMYGDTAEIGLSMAGSKRIYMTSTMVGINTGAIEIVKFEATLTTINTATTISGANTFTVGTGATTLGGILTVNGNTSISGTNTFTVGTGATTLGGTLTVTNNTQLNGTLTVATDKATTLGGTLTVTNNTQLNGTLTVATDKATTLGGILTVGATMSGKTVVLAPAADKMGISVTTSMATSPPNKIINSTGTGLYIRSAGEGLRLDSSDSSHYNIITFFRNQNGQTSGALSSTNRIGWMGYDSQQYVNVSQNMLFVNEQESEMRFYVGSETTAIGGKRMVIDRKGVSIGKSNPGDTKNRISRLFYGKIRIAPNGASTIPNANSGEILVGDDFTVTYDSYMTNTSASVKITANTPFHNQEIPVIITSIDSADKYDGSRFIVGTQWYHETWGGSKFSYKSFILTVSAVYVDENGQGGWGKYNTPAEDCVGVSFMVILPGGDFGMSAADNATWKQLS